MPAATLGWGICDTYPCMLFGDPAGHSVCIEWAESHQKYTCHMQLWVDSATFAFFLAACSVAAARLAGSRLSKPTLATGLARLTAKK